MAKEVGKIYRVKKQVQGVVPSTQNNEYFEPLDLISIPTDAQGSSEAIANNVIIRDNVGSAKVKMPSSVVDDTIINKSYLKAENVSLEDTKELEVTNVQEAIDNIVGVLEIVSNFIDFTNTTIGALQKRQNIPPYYIQFTDYSGVFYTSEEPTNWYKKVYGVDTTWRLMYNNDSIYFRTEGDLASSGRGNSLQEDAGRNLNGTVGYQSGVGIIDTTYSGYANGCFNIDIYKNVTHSVNPYDRTTANIALNASNQWSTANEFRTRNRLMRLYQLLTIDGKNPR